MSLVPGDRPAQPDTEPDASAERVLTAAADLCTMAGLAGATVDGIARCAGVGEDVIHLRWDSLTDIVTAAVVRDLQPHVDDMAGRMRTIDVLDERIVEAFTSVFWFLDGHPMVGGALRADPAALAATAVPSVAPLIAIAAGVVVDSIRESLHRNGIGDLDGEVLTELVARLIQSLLLAPVGSPPLASRSESAGYARRCIVPMVFALVDAGGRP
jgi:AcrR family transcriptional regulator